MRRADHPHIRGSTVPETGFPICRAAPSARSGYRSLSVSHIRAAIRRAAAAFQYVHDATDDPAIVRPHNTPEHPSAGKARSASTALRLAKTGSYKRSKSLPGDIQNRVVRPEELMSSNPGKLRTRSNLFPQSRVRPKSKPECALDLGLALCVHRHNYTRVCAHGICIRANHRC
jgi:hypothetical protein